MWLGKKISVNKKFIASGYEVSTTVPIHAFLNFVNVTGDSSMKPKKTKLNKCFWLFPRNPLNKI